MTNNVQTVQSNLYRAATTSFDFNNPSEALSELLALATQLTGAERAALYEFDEDGSGFTPRIAEGMALGDLGRLSSTAEHPVLREVIENHRAVATDGTAGSMGLPLAPGIVACAPCFTGDKTFGLMFVANNRGQPFSEDDLSTLEVLAARSAEVLAFARQTASRNYLFHKLSLLYQASHAITGTREREEAIRQMAAHVLKATSANICEVQVLEDGMEHTSRFQQPLGQAVPHTVTSDVSVNVPDYPIHDQVLSKLTPATISLQPPVGSGEDIALLQSEGYTAAAIFPLAVGNDPLGLVRILYDQPGRQISEQEMELAQAIVNIGAIGLQDAIHLETAESRANQLQVLSEIGREMTSTLDLEVALENSMRYAQEMLQAEACVLFLMDEEGEELLKEQTSRMASQFNSRARQALTARAQRVVHDRQGILQDIGDLFEEDFRLDKHGEKIIPEEITDPLLTRTRVPQGVYIEYVQLGDLQYTEGIVEIELTPLGLGSDVEFSLMNEDGDVFVVTWDPVSGGATLTEGRTT